MDKLERLTQNDMSKVPLFRIVENATKSVNIIHLTRLVTSLMFLRFFDAQLQNQ